MIAELSASKTHYQIIIKLAKNHTDTTTDEFLPNDIAHNTKSIPWDPIASLVFKEPGNSGSISPAVALGHELAHAYHFDTDPASFIQRYVNTRDPVYDNAEEALTIKSFENVAAKFFHQGVRSRHGPVVGDPAWDYHFESVSGPLKTAPPPR